MVFWFGGWGAFSVSRISALTTEKKKKTKFLDEMEDKMKVNIICLALTP